MRRLSFLQDDPWDEVNAEINRVRWFGRTRSGPTSSGRR
jgi:hypothetical protein